MEKPSTKCTASGTELTKSSIIGHLPKLCRADLEEVQAVATSLLGGRLSNVPLTPVGSAGAIFDALASVIGQRASLSAMPDSVIQKFHQKLPPLISFFDADFKGWNESRTYERAFLLDIMELLKSDLKRMEIQPTLTTMMNNFHRMSEVFDNAYPGYREAGRVDLIFTFGRKTKNYTSKKVRTGQTLVEETKTVHNEDDDS